MTFDYRDCDECGAVCLPHHKLCYRCHYEANMNQVRQQKIRKVIGKIMDVMNTMIEIEIVQGYEGDPIDLIIRKANQLRIGVRHEDSNSD